MLSNHIFDKSQLVISDFAKRFHDNLVEQNLKWKDDYVLSLHSYMVDDIDLGNKRDIIVAFIVSRAPNNVKKLGRHRRAMIECKLHCTVDNYGTTITSGGIQDIHYIENLDILDEEDMDNNTKKQNCFTLCAQIKEACLSAITSMDRSRFI